MVSRIEFDSIRISWKIFRRKGMPNVIDRIINDDQTFRPTRRNQERPHPGKPFVPAFESLSAVVAKCFGKDLVTGWEDAIVKFGEEFAKTGLYTKPKACWFRTFALFHVLIEIHKT